MSVLHEENFYILSEMGFQFRQDTGLTVDNWVSLLIGKVSAIRSDTIVPEGVIDKIGCSGFLLTHAVVEDFEGDFYIKAFNHQQLCGFLPFPVHENALRFIVQHLDSLPDRWTRLNREGLLKLVRETCERGGAIGLLKRKREKDVKGYVYIIV